MDDALDEDFLDAGISTVSASESGSANANVSGSVTGCCGDANANATGDCRSDR